MHAPVTPRDVRAHLIAPPSAHTLGFLARRLAELPVLLLVARRPDPDGGPVSAIASIAGATLLRPKPLGEEAVALLLRDAVEIGNTHWISGTDPHTHWVYAAKTRYRQDVAACSLGWLRGGEALIELAEPQWAVAPGQYAVVYESKVCLGGGVIV